MALFNPRYAQLLQQKGLANTSLNSNLIPTANPIARTLNTTAPITPQPAIRQQGFGTRFADTPPAFLTEKKVDNKIERTKKPDPPKKTKKKKRKTKNKK
jgi:hypothetical protein